jgi:hypothetical protein
VTVLWSEKFCISGAFKKVFELLILVLKSENESIPFCMDHSLNMKLEQQII